MSYNRWLESDYLAHHGVKGQKWGERNGPPYPLDSSKSDGHKLLKGDGSPQGKKKYKTSEKTAHKRVERKARTVKEESPEKTAKMQSAKNEDKWELDFLEFVQNEDWADDESPRFDKKRMLKEYSEYLDDREAYSQKGMADYARALFNTRFAKGNPEKYLSNVYKDRDNPINQMQQAELRGFLKNVPMSKRFKELQAEFERLDKESSELDLAYLEGRGDLNSYKKSLANLSKTYDQQKDEVCQMLGADPSKLKSIDKSQLIEDFKEAHSIGEYANKKSDTKPQKKSISNRINSLMDRVFGNSIKAQEKGQQKISVNYEPVTSEKAKTKRGETYEINDWNGDAQDTIKAFKSNPEPHINVARKAALQEARRIIGWYAKDNPEAQRFLNMSDQQLSKRIGLDFVSAYSHGTVEFSFGDAGTGDFLGHEVDVEYDLNRRKVMNVSVNG